MRHVVQTCVDDPVQLQEMLDEVVRDGSRILAVLWQPRRVDDQQAGAYDARGSFVIVSQTEQSASYPLREREAAVGAEVLVE